LTDPEPDWGGGRRELPEPGALRSDGTNKEFSGRQFAKKFIISVIDYNIKKENSMVFTEVAKTGEVLPGSMKHFEVQGKELLIANVSGKLYAMSDRCPHQNAPLSKGILQGTIVTCPLHFSRFDVTTGKMISGPVEAKMEGVDKLPPAILKEFGRIMGITSQIKVYDMETFPVRIEGQSVQVDL
jgi:nitrite reductase/ring-hydroxylating ferredoxin subunit